jgi:hypothetical protein
MAKRLQGDAFIPPQTHQSSCKQKKGRETDETAHVLFSLRKLTAIKRNNQGAKHHEPD